MGGGSARTWNTHTHTCGVGGGAPQIAGEACAVLSAALTDPFPEAKRECCSLLLRLAVVCPAGLRSRLGKVCRYLLDYINCRSFVLVAQQQCLEWWLPITLRCIAGFCRTCCLTHVFVVVVKKNWFYFGWVLPVTLTYVRACYRQHTYFAKEVCIVCVLELGRHSERSGGRHSEGASPVCLFSTRSVDMLCIEE